MQKLPDLEAWAIFATVAQEGSFAKAAQVLGLAQATVSKAVARLEKNSHTTLFHRTSRQITLTASGQVVLKKAQDLLHLGESLDAALNEQALSLTGVIRISAPMSFGVSHLAPLLPKFLQLHPGISLDVELDDQQVDLVAEGFDLSVRIAKLVDSSLLARRIRLVKLVLVAAPSYIQKYGSPVHPKDLNQHQALIYGYSQHGNWRFQHAQEGEFLQTPAPSNLKINNADALLPALLEGLGLALMPDFLVENFLTDGKLVSCMPDWYLEPVGLYLVTPPSRLRPARVEALIDYLVTNLS